jgi:hypothetical protein
VLRCADSAACGDITTCHTHSRFQPVTVPEPSIDETYEILQV